MKSKNIKNDNGLNEIYHQNGKIGKKYYKKDGKSNGLLRGWKSNGKLDWESTYKGGKLISDN